MVGSQESIAVGVLKGFVRFIFLCEMHRGFQGEEHSEQLRQKCVEELMVSPLMPGHDRSKRLLMWEKVATATPENDFTDYEKQVQKTQPPLERICVFTSTFEPLERVRVTYLRIR